MLCLIFSPTTLASSDTSGESIRVGVFQNKPIVYFADNRAQGLYIEVLEHVASLHQWRLEYVECVLPACVSKLENGEIDLMTSLGQSPKRLETLSFSQVPVWTFWGKLFSNIKGVNGLFDLQGKRIAVREGNKVTRYLRDMTSEFGIQVTFDPYTDYESAIEAFLAHEADLLAINNSYAFADSRIYQRYQTPIVFNPFSAFFAVKKGSAYEKLLPILDQHVTLLKNDPNSRYNIYIDKALGQPKSQPLLWLYVLLGGLALALMLALLSRYRSQRSLKSESRLKTEALTRVNQAEENLAESNRLLRLKNQSIEQFAYSLSHTLSSPIRTFHGFSSLLLRSHRDSLDSTAHDYLQRIQNAAIQLQKAIDSYGSLLDLNLKPIARKQVDLSEMASKMIQGKALAYPALSFESDIAPELVVSADPAMCEEVLDHLISNAIQFSLPTGKCCIALTRKSVEGKPMLCLKDHGIGFEMDYYQKLFEPFQKLHSAKTTDGSGMGLAIVKSIIDLHGGSIFATSIKDEGASVYFSFD